MRLQTLHLLLKGLETLQCILMSMRRGRQLIIAYKGFKALMECVRVYYHSSARKRKLGLHLQVLTSHDAQGKQGNDIDENSKIL